MLAGQVPPIPGAEQMVGFGDQDLTRLIDAHACFKGIRRPCALDDSGGNFIAYVLKPRVFFAYDQRPPVPWMRRRNVPPDTVFVAYARLDEPHDAAENIGVLTHWQFVEADEIATNMPVGFKERFVTDLW